LTPSSDVVSGRRSSHPLAGWSVSARRAGQTESWRYRRAVGLLSLVDSQLDRARSTGVARDHDAMAFIHKGRLMPSAQWRRGRTGRGHMGKGLGPYTFSAVGKLLDNLFLVEKFSSKNAKF